MSIRVKCEECGVALKIKDELAGQKGTCPQCKAPLQIPALNEESTPAVEKPPAKPEPKEVSEEEAIFGKGFFEASTPPPRPRTLDLSSDDDDMPGPAKTPSSPKKSKPAATGFTAAKPQTTENAADIASTLLSKTGKKNRPEDEQEPGRDKVEYDFSELKYLLKTRVLPAIGAILACIPLYFLIDSSMGSGPTLPPLAEVKGRVTVDGSPFPAMLLFFPADSNTEGSGSIGQCAPDGTYEVFYNADHKGAVIGSNTVRITAGALKVEETRDIVEGPNEFNFDLMSQ
ncbi:hypothetical protein GC176_22370 [bacterium]|nr:hypothetical protein [bacterium]